jgi:zeaxanthin epoxidase
MVALRWTSVYCAEPGQSRPFARNATSRMSLGKASQASHSSSKSQASAICSLNNGNRTSTVAGASTAGAAAATPSSIGNGTRVVVAGGGIGGLVLAVGLLKQGIDVKVLERDLTAIRGEGKYRGPIQVQSNALAALQALDEDIAEEVLRRGCITGDRINGLCDGVSGEWYCKFDTFHPAVDRGLPVTRVISRQILQEVLAKRVEELGGRDVVENGVNVVEYKHERDEATGKKTVKAITDDGKEYVGDMLIGSDGIWSKIRNQMIGPTEANYSQYTCYTGISDFTPADIDTVGYRVFLGHEQYFVSSDVGGGKMQWYAFNREPAGGEDEPGRKKERLMRLFGHWNDNVTELIMATPEDDVLRRDIYDRPPIFKWVDGRVALLGDSAHAMQPNLGQGGCMAIEDAFQLSVDIADELQKGEMNNTPPNFDGVLSGYFGKRVVRAAAIHGMAGMAAFMASTYKAHLGEGLGPLEWIKKFRIPHPGRVGGQFILKYSMPLVLEWVLGGYSSVLRGAGRVPVCRIEDKPLGFDESLFPTFMSDDDELLKAASAKWFLSSNKTSRIDLNELGPTAIAGNDCIMMRDGTYYLRAGAGGILLKRDGKEVHGGASSELALRPGDEVIVPQDQSDEVDVFVVKFEHASVAQLGHGKYDRRAEEMVRHPESSFA